MTDEQARTRRVLEEKHYESGRLNDESKKKADNNIDMRNHLESLEGELDALK